MRLRGRSRNMDEGFLGQDVRCEGREEISREPGSRIETVGTRRERKEGGRESKDRERALVRAGTRSERRRGRGEGGQGRIESVGKRAHERAHKERGEEAREGTRGHRSEAKRHESARGHNERGEEAMGVKDRDGWHDET